MLKDLKWLLIISTIGFSLGMFFAVSPWIIEDGLLGLLEPKEEADIRYPLEGLVEYIHLMLGMIPCFVFGLALVIAAVITDQRWSLIILTIGFSLCLLFAVSPWIIKGGLIGLLEGKDEMWRHYYQTHLNSRYVYSHLIIGITGCSVFGLGLCIRAIRIFIERRCPS